MLSEEFKKSYARLNAEQKKAVDTIEGPVMVIAGPGTGKTTLLTLRIANILKETDTPPSGILALTFTENGVRVMKEKLLEIIGNRAHEVRIHTFHGFASSVINEFDEHFPHLSRAKQMTDVEAEGMVREILKDKKFAKLRPLGEPDFYIWKILKTISNAKKEAWSPEIILNFATEEITRIQNDEDSISTRGASKGQLKADALKRIEKSQKTILFSEVYAAYEEKKRDQRKMDFDDLLFELLTTLKRDELLLRLLQEKFLYILVDEHQDTNDSQNEIVRLLANFFDSPNIFVVGDEKQAIYRFQGASVENFLRFQSIWKNMEVISLRNNYRSHQSILDATFSMIEENYEEGQYQNLRIPLHSTAKGGARPVDYIMAGNIDAADEYLVKALKNIVADEAFPTAAVIVRDNHQVSEVLSLCEENNISVSAERGADIFSHPLGVLYFELLNYLLDPSQTESLAATMAAGLWGFDFGKSADLIKKLRAGLVPHIEKEIPALEKLQNESTRLGVLEYLILASDLSGMTPRFAESPLSAEVWRGIMSLAKDLAESSSLEDPRMLMKEMLAYKISAEKKNIKVASGASDARIQVLTAHSSKGLEYDYVFLPFATENSWMKKHKGSSFVLPREKEEADDVRDARRLFYVALTRARKHVTIITSSQDALGTDLLPLRFIDELHKKHIAQIEVPALTKLPTKSTRDLEKSRKVEIVEYAKRMILENGLSVTALNHFSVCPSQFLYKSILKLPEPPSTSSEKGNAMHKALDDVWIAKENSLLLTPEKIAKIIEHSVKTYFQTSLLAKFEKEAVIDELVIATPKVAAALKDFFAREGSISSESWVETAFNTVYEKKPVTFNLHGKLDVMIETDKKVFVFDYKTRLAMSVNAIKGETQNEDGNYFRQLVFYKILVEGNSPFEGKEVLPALVFIKPDDKGRCPIIEIPIETSDEVRVKEEIADLVQSVWSGEFLSDTCEDKSCTWCKLKREYF